MSAKPTPAQQFAAAAVRIVAATEYFKAAGDLPLWARSEVESWDDPDAVVTSARRHGAVAASF